jgi:hypothetical protein
MDLMKDYFRNCSSTGFGGFLLPLFARFGGISGWVSFFSQLGGYFGWAGTVVPLCLVILFLVIVIEF